MNKCIVIIVFISTLFQGSSQKKPKEIVIEFYDWYLSVVNKQPADEYEPIFVINKNGMATLSIEKYINNLRKYNFSENMIKREISTYRECIENIEKVKYEILQSDFDYDEVGCNFVHYNKWTHSQETVDGVNIIEVRKLQNGNQSVKGQFYNFDSVTKEYLYWDWYCHILLVQVDKGWKIDEIEIKDK